MAASQSFVYSFIALICLCLSAQNLVNMRRYGHNTLSGRFLLGFVLCLCLCAFLETVYGLREAGLFSVSEAFLYAEEIAYGMTVMVGAYMWYVSSELYQDSPMLKTRPLRIFITAPLAVLSAILLFTPSNRQIFYFEDGVYYRGSLALLPVLVIAAFIVGTGIAALINSFRKRFYIERGYFRIIFLYAVILLAFQYLQYVYSSVLPFRTMGALLVVYMIQQKYIKEHIYTDALTGANNRNAADRFLSGRIAEDRGNLLLAMIDIDFFKQINDTYGHAAGDKAIKLLADAFMSSIPAGTFFGRYGGDEFLLASASVTPEEFKQIIAAARKKFRVLCAGSDGFELDFSCGIVRRTPEMKTIPDLLAAADARMYAEKRGKKAARQ